MSRRKIVDAKALPPPANDNAAPEGAVVPAVQVLIPMDLPILQVEIEIFAMLLDDWPVANDNDET